MLKFVRCEVISLYHRRKRQKGGGGALKGATRGAKRDETPLNQVKVEKKDKKF